MAVPPEPPPAVPGVWEARRLREAALASHDPTRAHYVKAGNQEGADAARQNIEALGDG